MIDTTSCAFVVALGVAVTTTKRDQLAGGTSIFAIVIALGVALRNGYRKIHKEK